MRTFFFSICLCLFASPALAGGFKEILSTGEPLPWENPTEIPLHPESGTCGDYLNSEMIDVVQEVMDNWSDNTEVDLGFDIQTGLGEVNATNFSAAFYGTTLDVNNEFIDYNPIIFDDDGSIMESLYGCENIGLNLGATSITHANVAGDKIARAAFVLSCACFRAEHTIFCDTDGDEVGDIDPCSLSNPDGDDFEFSFNVLRYTLQHEMGHFLNLDHTSLYEDLLDDDSLTNDDDVPVMFPSLQNTDRDEHPKQDDIIALATMYPSDTFADDYCTVTGTLVDDNTSPHELQCAAIFAIGSSASESIAFVTGSTAPGLDQNDDNDLADYNTLSQTFETSEDRGAFTLKLKPGINYEISVAAINADFIEGAGINPCKNNQVDACTADLLAKCTDDDTSTLCRACITDGTLIQASDYITTYAGLCDAGASIDLGDLTATNSLSLESAIELNGGTVPSEDDDTSSSSSCQLQTSAHAHAAPFFFTLTWIAVWLVLQNLRRKAKS